MAQDEANFGQICWLEVPVSSVHRAAAFYSSVLGWECKDVDEGKPPAVEGIQSIHMFSKGNLHGAFLVMQKESSIPKIADPEVPEKCPPLPTFRVTSIDETLENVVAAGGKVHIPRTKIGGDMGYFARFIDTEGNVMGLWAFK
ncbi:hypothetical protein VTK73DRAFT_8627 [Phialemonium thermophilum]|uniref:VOC domain-containing protein n=1 Tax=Phialemonium thermophilum TaxID=223376 RepID=A0ABR3W7W6_9PEZI